MGHYRGSAQKAWFTTQLDAPVRARAIDAEIAAAVVPVLRRTLELHAMGADPDGALCFRVATRVMELIDDEAEACSSVDDEEWARMEATVGRLAKQILSALKEPDVGLN